jgi:hypothetical protein
MWEALRDWDHIRDTLRQDLGDREEQIGVSPWLRAAAWAALTLGWTLVGWPVLALPTVIVFEAVVVPGLGPRRQRELGRLTEWSPPDSFVISPESVPGRPASR